MSATKREAALLALSDGPMTTIEIARAAGYVNGNAAFAELARLQARGLVQRSKSGGRACGRRSARRWRLAPEKVA